MYSKDFIFFDDSRLLDIHIVGMGVMLATIWIRLPQVDSRINDRLGVHFYSVAFLAFMSVAGIPSFVRCLSFLFFHHADPNGASNSSLRNVPYFCEKEAMVCTLLLLIRE
jgi:hypothetical protein